MADKRGEVLRYESQGELHRDFHASTVDGFKYVLNNYGEAAAREVVGNTAQKVYKTMHEKLVAGDKSELVAWWRYYLDREGGEYALEETADGAVLTVKKCPAITHLVARGIEEPKTACVLTRMLNAALCEGSPFEIVLEETGEAACRQTLRRK